MISIDKEIGKMADFDYDKDIKAILEKIKNRVITPQDGHRLVQELKRQRERSIKVTPPLSHDKNHEKQVGDIAVIGMSGRFPDADHVDEFWHNLSGGKDAVTEVPLERWDNDAYYHEDARQLDKTNSRYGGFLRDIDKFDPLFFNISGMEAEVMDPQQRLFLEESWRALEDAGYAHDGISRCSCGVYVGTAPRDYLTHITDKGALLGAQAFWGNTGSLLASRISYYLNLKGPAIAVDTACSSSLVAVHLACQGLISGEVDMAIAGGVWICTTPHYYILTSNAGMLSKEGRCRTFDNDANGIVNGEGVGAIVLKPMEKALKDGDHIYGIIKSSGINQDGKTNGITAPSSLSQTELELEVYRKGNIHPETITYVEAHGTGTKLGDPIEVEALSNAFRRYTDKEQFCALGSVKTNIGHASLAAGIASVIKVLLCLQHKQIPPSLHYKRTNENIDLDHSPFYVNTELREWKSEKGPLRSAISSFGLGGTNAHLVMEEFQETRQWKGGMKPFYIATFSAKTEEGLKKRIRDFIKWSKKNPGKYPIGDICYTLNSCRQHSHIRKAFIIREQKELEHLLEDYIRGKQLTSMERKADEEMIWKNIIDFIEELKYKEISKDRHKEILIQIANYYEKNGKMQWDKFYGHGHYRKISLPTYPFARECYWVKDKKPTPKAKTIHSIHPLIHENVSNLKEQVFKTVLEGHETFEKECFIAQRPFIPFAYMVEMAFYTGEISLDNKVKRMEDMKCANPIIPLGQEQLVKTRLYPYKQGCYMETLFVQEEKERVYAQGKIKEDYPTQPILRDTVDMNGIYNKCTLIMEGNDYYSYLYDNYTYNYGESLKSIQKIHYNATKTEAIAELVIPVDVQNNKHPYVLHPSLLEGIFQTCLMGGENEKNGLYCFGGFGTLEVLKPLEDSCFVHTVLAAPQEKEEDSLYYDIHLMNAEGLVVLKINYLHIRRLEYLKDSKVNNGMSEVS